MAAEALVAVKARAPTIPKTAIPKCFMVFSSIFLLRLRQEEKPDPTSGAGGFSQRISADSGFPVLPGARRLRNQPATGSGVPGILR
jgi:hypothetical protein